MSVNDSYDYVVLKGLNTILMSDPQKISFPTGRNQTYGWMGSGGKRRYQKKKSLAWIRIQS